MNKSLIALTVLAVLAFILTAEVVPVEAQSMEKVIMVYPDQYYPPEQGPYVKVFVFDDPHFATPKTKLPPDEYGNPRILVGHPIDIVQPEWKPFTDQNGRAQFPIRFIAETLGYQVDWDGTSRKVTLSKDGHTVVMYVGKRTYYADGVAKQMDTEPFLQANRTFVPLRFVAEGLGYEVEWKEKHRFVYIKHKRYAQKVAARGIAHSPAMLPVAGGAWPLPPEFRTVTSKFGYRVHPFTGKPSFHEGIDIEAPEGTPVYSAWAGVVVAAGWDNALGNYIVVASSGGIRAVYGHLSRITIEPGGKVGVGQVIGYVGSTGWSTGPHLHFQVEINGTPCDPLEWLGVPR